MVSNNTEQSLSFWSKYRMLLFLKKRSYDIVKMFINQLALSIFGNALALATGETMSGLRIATSLFSVGFYLFLIYIMLWDLGAKERHRLERGEEGQTKLSGLYMALVASAPNLLLAILVAAGTFLPALGNVGGACKLIALFLEGMYTGLLAIPVGGTPLHSTWFVYFLLPIPLIATATVAYLAGTKEFRIFGGKR